MNLRPEILALRDELISLRREIHMYPELGFQEFRTAERIERYLADVGLEPIRLAKTGVVANLPGDTPGPTLLLRADIDALPITEANDVSYRSRNPGIMHACGHDAHTAMLLVAAKLLVRRRSSLKGNVKFLFQPNEEVAGAEVMIGEGALENPRVDAAIGLHIWTPLPSGTIAVTSGPVMAAMRSFRITVIGRGGHSGYPEDAIDPVLAAADIVQTSQRLQTRDTSLLRPTTLVFSRIEGGTKSNVIPGEVTLEGTLRYLYAPDDGKDPTKRLEEIVRSVAATHRCTIEFTFDAANDAVVNDPNLVHLVRETASEIVDPKSLLSDYRSMAGEDFSAYGRRVPAAFVFIGTGNAEIGTDYPHHSPHFNVDEDTLPIGVELLVRTSLRFLS